MRRLLISLFVAFCVLAFATAPGLVLALIITILALSSQE